MNTAKLSSINNVNDFNLEQPVKDYFRTVDTDIKNLFLLSQNRVSFGDGSDGNNENISGVTKVFTSSAIADNEDTIAHGFSVVPVGYIVLRRNKSGVLYDSDSAWDTTNIYLKSTVANTQYTIFILK